MSSLVVSCCLAADEMPVNNILINTSWLLYLASDIKYMKVVEHFLRSTPVGTFTKYVYKFFTRNKLLGRHCIIILMKSCPY